MSNVHPDYEPSALRDRLAHARDFPNNTCPASRHAQIIGEAMIEGSVSPAVLEDPVHAGTAILSTVISLYETRSRLARYEEADEALLERVARASLAWSGRSGPDGDEVASESRRIKYLLGLMQSISSQ